MTLPARRLMAAFALGLTMITAGWTAPGGAAHAQGLFDQPKYAAIVVDAKTGEVLYNRRADAQRYPASITKVMTLYLTFEALATGRLSLNDTLVMSQHAASQAPSKLGLKPGQSISVDNAIRAAAVKSANDMAVLLAERVGGSEDRFAQLMTLRAQELGMRGTHFANATGLPNARHYTTARDIAILSRAVMRDYPQYYGYFSQKQFAWRGQNITNHNRLMLRMAGMDGLKTGYTNSAGFTLAASAVRDGRRLITVVLGGNSTASRDENVETLLRAGFDVLNRRAHGQNITVAANIAEPDDVGGPVTRPETEMGSAEQKGLEVELADATASQARSAFVARTIASTPVPNPAAAALPAKMLVAAKAPPKADPKLADCAKAERQGRHGRRSAPSCALQTAKADVADCAKLHRAKRRACERKADAVQVAKAEPAKPAAADCAKLKRGRRHACEAQTTQVADASSKSDKGAKGDAAGKGGKYLIQVGAYGNKRQAEDHLAKVSGKFGAVVSGGDGQVSSAAGNFRVRFSGFSSAAAKSACQKLSAKGERCMVMASS